MIPRKHSKALVTLLIISIALLLGGTFFLFQQKSEQKPAPFTEKTTWNTYTNDEMGFSIDLPDKVLTNLNDSNSWAKLNIFEYGDSVYFTTHTLKYTLENDYSWNFRIGGDTVTDKENAVLFLEKYYNAQECGAEFVEESDSEFFTILLIPNSDSCRIGGKIKNLYDEDSGKIITYQLLEHFFFVPNGSLDEQALESFKFTP